MVKDFLEGDHKSLGALLPEFENSLARNELTRAFESLNLFWARLATHIRAENLCLFPAILNARPELFRQNGIPAFDEVRATIAALRADHNFFMDSLAKAIRIMRDLIAHPGREGPPQIAMMRDTVTAVKQRLDDHNKTEEGRVYRWPLMLLSPTELARLDAEVHYQVESLPSRFTEDSAKKSS